MKFKLNRLITTLIIAFITVTTFAMPANAFFFNISQIWFNSSDEGYFKKIGAPSLYGEAIKLNDGRLLFMTKEKVTIFNPKTNIFIEKKPLNQDINSYDGILLNNGKVLFAGAIEKYEQPSRIFKKEIYRGIFVKPNLEARFPNKNKEYMSYLELPEEEKKKVYLPFF